jgi:hypothetical protein
MTATTAIRPRVCHCGRCGGGGPERRQKAYARVKGKTRGRPRGEAPQAEMLAPFASAPRLIEPFVVSGKSRDMTVSVGIASLRGHGQSLVGGAGTSAGAGNEIDI